MTPDLVTDVVQRMLTMGVMLALPILGAGLVVGLAIAVIQAATQIQESSLTFVPKLLAMGAAVVVLGPWALDKLVTFTQAMLSQLGHLVPAGL